MGIGNRRRVGVALSVALVSLSILGLDVGPAGATPPPGSPSHWSSAPDSPSASVSPIDDAASALGIAGRNHFGSSFYDVAVSKASVDVYMTDAAAGPSLVAQARRVMRASSAKVPVNLHVALYKRSTLQAAAKRIFGLATAWRDAGVEVYGIAIRSDGSGLTVDTNQPEQARSLLASSALLDVAAENITFQMGTAAEPTSRYDDYAPYAGGVYMNTEPGHFCTTGFGMRLSTGATEMVTAAHCARSADTITDGGGQVIGTVGTVYPSRDAEDIPTSTWQGVYTLGESYTVYKNWNYNYNGQTVCQSGYTSNQICGLVVTNDDYMYTLATDWGSTFYVEGVQASNTSCGGCVAVAGGDSGGPVWVSASGGVQSRGINSAGQGGVIGYAPNGNPQYHILLFNETGWILQAFGGSLLVG